jgi:two-component system chemotaxis response regulator CheB
LENRIRVLIVDDSAIVRKILSDALSHEPDIEVAGTAPDPLIARTKMLALRPDVVTLDIEMPRMDGLTFLREIMAERPVPVIMISSLAQHSCAVAMEALEAGAVDVLAKPAGPYSVGELRISLANKIRSAARARLPRARDSQQPLPPVVKIVRSPAATPAWAHLVAIGASTGGTEAIRNVLQQFPEDCPPVVVVQHIPAVFSKAFANRLNSQCRIRVEEATDGQVLQNGLALIAPGDQHMVVRKAGARISVQLHNGPRVCYQRPSVDVLFHSVAEGFGSKATGVLLTGMGSDGAAGLLRMKTCGAHTITQDEATCVVYGMPREAVRLGASDESLPLDRIAAAVVNASCLAHSQ